MRILSWLDSCSSSTSTSDSPSSSSSSSTSTSTNSLHSNLSVQTHPSIPSLHHHHHVATSHHCLLTQLNPHPSHSITSLALHGHLLFAASSHNITLYNRHTLSPLPLSFPSSSSGSTKSLTFSNTNNLLFTTHQDSKIRLWKPLPHKTTTYHLLTSLPTLSDRLRRSLLPTNYLPLRRHRKRLWIRHADAVTALALHNHLIYSVSWDKTLKVWRSRDLRCLQSVTAHDDAVNALVVSTDGTVYTGSADKRIRAWTRQDDDKRHVLLATLERHKSAVNALALNGEGSVLFSGACDRTILVWGREDSANHMAVIGALRGHEGAILCLVNVRDLLLSGSADRTVRIWKQGVMPGSSYYCCVTVLVGHQKPVKSLAAVVESEEEGSERNGDVSVFSGSLDGEIRVWRVSIRDVDGGDLNDTSSRCSQMIGDGDG